MKKVKFGIFTDLHYEHIHDGLGRIERFVEKLRDENVDFIVELGDFCCPTEENKVLVELLNNTGKTHYHLIGNHDSDTAPREKVMEFLGMENSYYSFKYGDIKFIALDTCYIKTANGYEPYNKRNYNKTKDIYPMVPDFELEWIEKELYDECKYYVIFSHHSLENEFGNRGVYNRAEVRALIDKANSSGRKVLLSINGHDHGDAVNKLGQTYYFGLNSMSYIWFGNQYEHFTYSDEIHRKYPFIKDLVLYEEGLYSIITIFENGSFEIQGMNGSYQTISPSELGLGEVWNGRSILPKISSLIVE